MKRAISPIMAFLLFGTMFSCNPPERHIWMIGDSTMAVKSENRRPESGWGEALPGLVKENVTVHNHAAGGRSTLSFINEGRWNAVLDSLQKGDYVIIQFGHNDEKADTARHTEPYGSFKKNLHKFVDDSRAKGATPVICSSIVRRHFDGNGNLIDSHGDYIPAAHEAAEEADVYYIDLNKLSGDLVQEWGPEKSKQLFTFTEHRQDSSHLSVAGSSELARLFVSSAKDKNIPIVRLFN